MYLQLAIRTIHDDTNDVTNNKNLCTHNTVDLLKYTRNDDPTLGMNYANVLI